MVPIVFQGEQIMLPTPKSEPGKPPAELVDEELDEALEESFPASDPPAVGGSD
jgi:hypothetical protein